MPVGHARHIVKCLPHEPPVVQVACVQHSAAARSVRRGAGELDAQATVLRFYYVDSPPPLTVGLFFIHNHADGTYSGARARTRPAHAVHFNLTLSLSITLYCAGTSTPSRRPPGCRAASPLTSGPSGTAPAARGVRRAGGLSFTRADTSAVGEGAGSGGGLRSAANFEAALRGLTMYPQVSGGRAHACTSRASDTGAAAPEAFRALRNLIGRCGKAAVWPAGHAGSSSVAVPVQKMRAAIAGQLAERPWYTSGSTLQVSRLTGPRVVLLGDAAHAGAALLDLLWLCLHLQQLPSRRSLLGRHGRP